jgi:hypothetical protein
VEHLAALIGAGVRVEVAEDGLEQPVGILESHILILAALRGDLLFALLVPGRCAVTAWLQLLLLTELFRELLDLLTLLSVVALGVVHRAPRTTFVVAGRLTWALVVMRATSPTSRCCCSSGTFGQWLVFAASLLLLLLLLLLTAALCSGICVRLVSLPYLWGRL